MMMKHGNKVLAREIMTQARPSIHLQTLLTVESTVCLITSKYLNFSLSLLPDIGEHKEETGGEIP